MSDVWAGGSPRAVSAAGTDPAFHRFFQPKALSCLYNSSATLLDPSRCFQDPGTSFTCFRSYFDAFDLFICLFHFCFIFLSFFSKVTVLKVPGTVSRNEKDRLKKTPAFA